MQGTKGRLSQSAYWGFVGMCFAVKVGMVMLLPDKLSGTIAIDVAILIALIARFRDFDQPAWFSVILWLLAVVVWPTAIMIMIGVREISDVPLIAVGPGIVLTIIAGCIPGTAGPNAFGSHGQSFADFLTKRSDGSHARPDRFASRSADPSRQARLQPSNPRVPARGGKAQSVAAQRLARIATARPNG